MNMHALKCPNCGASLEIEDGVDTFFCKYCGYKIILEGQSDQAYKSKTKIKGMEHEERMLDKKLNHEKYKIEKKREKEKAESKKNYMFFAGLFALLFVCIFMLAGPMKWSSNSEERKLQKIVDEIMVDIENEEFDAAYIKAQSLIYTSGYSHDTEKKWDETRRALIDQIIEAEKKATGSSSHKPESKGIIESIFG